MADITADQFGMPLVIFTSNGYEHGYRATGNLIDRDEHQRGGEIYKHSWLKMDEWIEEWKRVGDTYLVQADSMMSDMIASADQSPAVHGIP